MVDSNALIGDPSQMSYRAQGPAQPSSAEPIQSQMQGGQRFSAVDKQATDALLKFVQSTNDAIEGYANKAEFSKNTYMTADAESRARVENVVQPVVSVGPNAGGTPNG